MSAQPVTTGNPSPFAGPKPPPAPGPEATPDEQRNEMTVWARWAIAHHGSFTYSEAWPARWHMVESPPGTLPMSADCSGFCSGLAKWVGAGDPSGLAFTGGYTGTMLQHMNRILPGAARMGDLIVYGPGTGSHVVYIMERLPGNDFWCCSHGKPGDPERVKHSALLAYFGPRSARFLRWLS